MNLVSNDSDPGEDRGRLLSPPRLGASLPTQAAHHVVFERSVRRWRAFALLVVAYFMTIVDLTIVNVALPTIGVKLHFPESDLQWVVTAYGLTFGGFLLLGGTGRRPARSSTHAHGGPGRLLRRVPCLWIGDVGHLLDHHARVSGPGGGHRAAGRPLHRDEHVPRRRRAQ